MNAALDDDNREFIPFLLGNGSNELGDFDLLDREITQEHSRLARDLQRSDPYLRRHAAEIKAWAMMITSCI